MSRLIQLWLMLGLLLTAALPANAQLAEAEFAEKLG
jgi:hypothetical protein